MDSKNNMRITSFKHNSLDFFADFYIGIMIEREIEESKKIFRLNSPIIGLRGEQHLEAGFIYAPYIPVMIDQASSTFIPSKEIMSRYTKIVNSSLYGVIKTSDIKW